MWRNWYSRRIQNPLGEIPCGFESHHPHQILNKGSVVDNKFEWSYIHLKNHLLTISRGQYLYMDSDCVLKVGFLTDYEPAE